MKRSDFRQELITQLRRFIDLLIADKHGDPIHYFFTGIIDMEFVKDDAPNRIINFTQPNVVIGVDAEGNSFAIMPKPVITYKGISDNESAVQVTNSTDGSVEISFGSPGLDGADNVANITYVATGDDSFDYGIVAGKQYIVQHGDAVSRLLSGVVADDGSGIE